MTAKLKTPVATHIRSNISFTLVQLTNCSNGDCYVHLLEYVIFVFVFLQLLLVDLFDVPIFQPTSPVRAEVDVKLGGTQCNIIMSRFKPWLHLHFSEKKRMVLREETSIHQKPQSTEPKAIMWTSTVSAPEMTIVLYSISGVPLYHVSDFA